MSDIVVLFGFIIIGTIVLTWVHNLFEIIYWKYIDWKYNKEEINEDR